MEMQVGRIGESAKDFENVWVFETADPNRYINQLILKCFGFYYMDNQ